MSPGVQQGRGSVALGALSTEMPPEPVSVGSRRLDPAGVRPLRPQASGARAGVENGATSFWNCCCAWAERWKGRLSARAAKELLFPFTANGTGFPLTVVELFSSLRHSVRFEKLSPSTWSVMTVCRSVMSLCTHMHKGLWGDSSGRPKSPLHSLDRCQHSSCSPSAGPSPHFFRPSLKEAFPVALCKVTVISFVSLLHFLVLGIFRGLRRCLADFSCLFRMFPAPDRERLSLPYAKT